MARARQQQCAHVNQLPRGIFDRHTENDNEKKMDVLEQKYFFGLYGRSICYLDQIGLICVKKNRQNLGFQKTSGLQH